MLLARLLALLGLLLLASVTQAAPGVAPGPGLVDMDALVEAPSRLHQLSDSDGPEGLSLQAQSNAARPCQSTNRVLPSQRVTSTWHLSAQPRAPPFAKS